MKFHFLVQTQSTHAEHYMCGSTFYIRKGNRYFLHPRVSILPRRPSFFPTSCLFLLALSAPNKSLKRAPRIKLETVVNPFLDFSPTFSRQRKYINHGEARGATFSNKRSFQVHSRFLFVLVACAVFLLPRLFDLSECR